MQVHSPDSYDMHRFQVGRCDVCIFVLKSEPRVFIGGGEFGYDGLAREADIAEIEALAERFGITELNKISSKRRLDPRQIDNPANPQPPA